MNRKCYKCKNEINSKEKNCPNCGANQMLVIRKISLIIFALFILLIIVGIILPKDWKLKYGELIELKENCLKYDENNNCINYVAIIKAKIKSSYNNESTINQNYFNVTDFIKKNNGIQYDEIQYWAVADMDSGKESKVISFTLPKDLIEKIDNEKISDNKLGDYVEDLYIHSSLKND